MICDLSHIEQPYSGEYEEKIYDINSSWNSGDWSWILFEKEDGHCFCGEFRGKYRGAVLSEKLAVIIVLTSDYLFILDLGTAKLLDYKNILYLNQICLNVLERFFIEKSAIDLYDKHMFFK